jgi:hypothetical protein
MKYRVSAYYHDMLLNSLRMLRTSLSREQSGKDSKSVTNLCKYGIIACIDLAMNCVVKGRNTEVSKMFLYISVCVYIHVYTVLVLRITVITAFSSLKKIIIF